MIGKINRVRGGEKRKSKFAWPNTFHFLLRDCTSIFSLRRIVSFKSTNLFIQSTRSKLGLAQCRLEIGEIALTYARRDRPEDLARGLTHARCLKFGSHRRNSRNLVAPTRQSPERSPIGDRNGAVRATYKCARLCPAALDHVTGARATTASD